MYIHGQFYNEKNERIEVHILIRGDRTNEVEIGAKGCGINWTDDPVEIESQVSDTFDVLLKYQATIRLLVKNFIPDLFCTSCRDAVVNIYREGECLFAGFIEPQTYSQPYNEEEDEIELSCIDVLTALQYGKYRNVGVQGITYREVKENAGQRSFLDIIRELLSGLSDNLDILGKQSLACYYDGSIGMNKSEPTFNIFSQIGIHELLFLSDNEDNVWTAEEVLTELLKYLNQHIVQQGFSFYIFSWESIKKAENIEWKDLYSNKSLTTPYRLIGITTDKVSGTDTTISVGEIYNQLLLTCKVEKMESLIESPLKENELGSYFMARQKYMSELISLGDGKRALRGFYEMVFNGDTDYDDGSIVDWYVWIKRHPEWKFLMHDNIANADKDLNSYFGQDGKNQQAMLQWLGKHLGAGLVSYGKVERAMARKDNSPVSKINMETVLVLSVNGNGKNSPSEAYPNVEALHEAIPYATYVGQHSGGVFSPVDEETINYIVFSGKMLLNPIMEVTGRYNDLRTKEWILMPFAGKASDSKVPINIVKNKSKDKCYYTRLFWKQQVSDPRQNEEALWDKEGDSGWYPFTDTAPEEYEFKYSSVGDGTDKISKVGLVACMLIIGDKCVVETGSGSQMGDFEWRKYKERSECSSDDEYYQQSFTIGFDPKIGDKLIGHEYSLQNNISWKHGVDSEGMAIPIRKRDHVAGAVKFIVLGPVNVLWSDITRRHPTFFRHTKWTEDAIPLLAHISSIQIKSFEVKVVSDNGKTEQLGDDHDIVYMSAAQSSFCNRKDDLEFKVTSALTHDECMQIGVKNALCLSTPVGVASGDGILTLYNRVTDSIAKPEQLYVNSYYQEYHAPRVIMTQHMTDIHGGFVDTFAHYRHNFLNKNFFVQGISRNLAEGTAELTLKEIDSND